MSNGSDDFEILDLSSYRRPGWIHNAVSDVSRRPVVQQVAIGGVSGVVSGYLFIKVGKLAAFTLGTSLLVLQIAQHQGYVKINWNLLEKDVKTAKKRFEREAQERYPGVVDSMKRFFKNNIFLAGSFTGGFFLGMAF